ncbi:hypothetical protein J4234_02665 [Candidatus Woesearchaeota archaeon]|nr:hypothetical protein [Candidatus Woesearchaeota archaeon]
MPNLTYNIIVQADRVGFNYWERIRDLAKAYGIQGSLIVCNTNRVTVVSFKERPIETKVFKGKPYGMMPVAVNDYEAGIPQTDTPRWVIAPPSVIDKVSEGLLRNAGVLKGSKFFYVEIGAVYDNNGGPINYGQATLPEVKSLGADDVADKITDDRLAKLLETARIQEVRTDPKRPNLAELIEKVSR